MPRPKPAVPTLTIVLTPVRPAPIQLMQPEPKPAMPTPLRPSPPSPEYALQHFRSVETVVPGDRHVLLEGEVVVFALPLRHVVNHVRCTPRDRPADSRPDSSRNRKPDGFRRPCAHPPRYPRNRPHHCH